MKLEKYLHDNRITKSLFAKMCGVSRATLFRYMTGKSTPKKAFQLAIKYLSNGEVTEKDWD